jgi:hypothetical protein
MAQRRMFSKTITESDVFLDMPLSSQALYLHLGMQADDDGFVSPSRVVRMIGAQPDDLRILVAKNLVIPFDDGVVVITHWQANNYIQKDRYMPTIHQEKLSKLSQNNNGVYIMDTSCIQNVRVGKVSKGKYSIDKSNITSSKLEAKKDIFEEIEIESEEERKIGKIVNEVIDEFKAVNPSYSKLFKIKAQRDAVESLLKQHGEEPLKAIVRFLANTNGKPYAPVITTPIQLVDKLGSLIAFTEKIKESNNKREIIGL